MKFTHLLNDPQLVIKRTINHILLRFSFWCDGITFCQTNGNFWNFMTWPRCLKMNSLQKGWKCPTLMPKMAKVQTIIKNVVICGIMYVAFQQHYAFTLVICLEHIGEMVGLFILHIRKKLREGIPRFGTPLEGSDCGYMVHDYQLPTRAIG